MTLPVVSDPASMMVSRHQWSADVAERQTAEFDVLAITYGQTVPDADGLTCSLTPSRAPAPSARKCSRALFAPRPWRLPRMCTCRRGRPKRW